MDAYFVQAILRITSSVHPAHEGPGIVVAAKAARTLASTHEWVLSTQLQDGERFTAELPHVPPSERRHLDERGVVTVGSYVVPGMVLVGKLGPPLRPEEQSTEQRKLRKLVDRGPEPRDASLRCSRDAHGRVREVRAVPPLVEVVVVVERALAVGDVLRVGRDREDVVAAIVDEIEGAEVSWPGIEGEHLVEKVQCAEDSLHSRSIGPYSLLTRQPLEGKASFGGQRVGPAELAALFERRAPFIAHELMTIKSDEDEGRSNAFESIVMGKPACNASTPRATKTLESQLRALGFDVDFSDAQPSISLFDDAKIRTLMPGVVTRSLTLNWETLKPEPDGLFCEDLFGSYRSLPIPADRATRMARIELPVPVLHPWAFDAIAEHLAISADLLLRVLYGTATLEGTHPERWTDTGAWALRAAAGERAAGMFFECWPVLPPDLRPIINHGGGHFSTSDLNAFYEPLINQSNALRGRFARGDDDYILSTEAADTQRLVDALVQNGLRQEPVEDEGRVMNSLADMLEGPQGHFQRRLLSKVVDYSAIARVVARPNLGHDSICVPRTAALELFTPWVYATLERKGVVSSVREARKLVAAKDPTALEALDEIVAAYPVVVFPAEPKMGGSTTVASFDVVLWDEAALGLTPAAMRRLELPPAALAVVHVPIDPRAIAEARTSLRRPRIVRSSPAPPTNWLARTCRAERVGPILIAAALRHEADPVDDDLTRLMLGRSPSASARA